jgi:hypothetical protein
MQRTIVFGSWDGEEYNLQGSTAWGEEHADELARQAIAYVNVVCPWLAVERVPCAQYCGSRL